MLSAVILGSRGIQAILSIAVLGLAVTIVKQQWKEHDSRFSDAPTPPKYSSFTGAFGIIVSAIGIASLYSTMIPEIAVMVLDALLGIFFLAGGIAYAVGLKEVSCTDDSAANYLKMRKNPLLNEGSMKIEGIPSYGIEQRLDGDAIIYGLLSNCKRVLSDEILQFVMFGLAFGFLALGYLRLRKGSGGPTSSAV